MPYCLTVDNILHSVVPIFIKLINKKSNLFPSNLSSNADILFIPRYRLGRELEVLVRESTDIHFPMKVINTSSHECD